MSSFLLVTSRGTRSSTRKLLEGGSPYSYVRGELWHVVARLGDHQTISDLRQLAIADFNVRPLSIPLEWGTLALLVRAEREGLGSAWRFVKRATPLTQGLISEILPPEHLSSTRFGHLLAGDEVEAVLPLTKALVHQGKTHLDFGLKSRDLSTHLAIALRHLGVIRGQSGAYDQIASILSECLGTNGLEIWRRLLGTEYTYGLRILRRGVGLYESHPSVWLQAQDSFNDLVLRQFISFLGVQGLPGNRLLINKKGELIPVGSLLQTGHSLTTVHAALTDPFRACHERRNKVPGSHPYQAKGGARNTYLFAREKRALARDLSTAFDYLGTYVDLHW